MDRLCNIIMSCVLLLLLVLPCVLSFSIKEFEVPSEVPEGGLVKLRCEYELAPYKQIYTLRWLRNNVEFYRYDPQLDPKHNFYRMHGLHVNVSVACNVYLFD